MAQAAAAGKAGKAERIQVKILKNRNGSKEEFVLDFYPKFNYFTAVKDAENADVSIGDWKVDSSTKKFCRSKNRLR